MTDADKQDKNEMKEWKAEKRRGLVINNEGFKFCTQENFCINLCSASYLKITSWPSFGVKSTFSHDEWN